MSSLSPQKDLTAAFSVENLQRNSPVNKIPEKVIYRRPEKENLKE